ncbi:Cytochrome P450 [Macrophomina phaseolina MS6]|uniref:Cytochrome P450 n=1 Tax=Macrophomina phaseolina (strain MS6) TaxID=1126212 RepID=K2SB50_MACPH|nr:Cytochrome P450 [Macrophomina phaseolina MS6]
MWFFAEEPPVLAKFRAELETATVAGLIPSSEPVSYQQAQKLPYLQAVISEGLRVHSPPGVPLSREVPKGVAEVAGTFFPEGSSVGMNAWVMHLDKEAFGEDAEEDRPERWLVSKEDVGRMDRNILTWGLGSRTCIGKNIALMEICLLIPELVRKFDFELVHPSAGLETRNVLFVKQKNFWVKVKERRANARH